jgi:hypothetical protein
MVDCLKHMIEKGAFILQSGDLRASNSGMNVGLILAESLSSAVMIQYDRYNFFIHVVFIYSKLILFFRLDALMKKILKIASVLGQYFDIRDVMIIGNITNYNIGEIMEYIRLNNSANFLELPDDGNEYEDDPTSDDESDSAHSSSISKNLVYQYGFRHIASLNAIYESLSYFDRTHLNRRAAEYYESKISNQDAANQFVLIPIIFDLYKKTNSAIKILEYGEKLGFYYIDRYLLVIF